MPPRTVVPFVAGGLLGLLVSWEERMTKLSVEEVAALFRRMAIAASESGLR